MGWRRLREQHQQHLTSRDTIPTRVARDRLILFSVAAVHGQHIKVITLLRGHNKILKPNYDHSYSRVMEFNETWI